MEKKVLEILRGLFEDDTLDETCSQKNCEKWDSMNQLNLTIELEDAFGISLEPEEIGEMTCFEDIVKVLKNKMMP